MKRTPAPEVTPGRPATGGQLALDLLPTVAPSLANFVAGRNAAALAAVAAAPAARGPAALVYLWGEPGSGRSHLLRACAAAGAWWWQAGADPAAPGVALVDDVEQLDDDHQAALFSRLDAVLTAAGDPAAPAPRCVVAGDTAPAFLPLRDDVRSRLATGAVHRLHALDDEEKAAALAARARARGASVDAALIPYLLTHHARDMGVLAAIVDALDAYALHRQRALTVPLLKEWLAAGSP